MPTYKTVIIGKNDKDFVSLRKTINEHSPNINIVAEAYTSDSAKDIILSHQPNLAFMAIELVSGTSFELLSHLKVDGAIDFEIIFISTNQRYDYALKAIDFSPVALLNTPIDPEILRGVIEKAKNNLDKKSQIEQIVSKTQTSDEHQRHIVIPSVNHTKVSITVADITHFKAEGQTTIIHFHDGTTLTAFSILGHFKKLLLDKHAFYLIHNSLLVNTHQVKVFKYAELEITFKNGKKLNASRRNGKEFKKYWEEFQ